MYILNTEYNENICFIDRQTAVDILIRPITKRDIRYNNELSESINSLKVLGYIHNKRNDILLVDIFFDGEKNRIYKSYYNIVYPSIREFQLKQLLNE